LTPRTGNDYDGFAHVLPALSSSIELRGHSMLEHPLTLHQSRRRRRRPSWVAVRAALAAFLFVGCSDAVTSARSTRPAKASMSISASISSRAATQVLLVALYSSDALESGEITDEPGGAGYLGMQPIDLTSAGSLSVPMEVNLAQCLADKRASTGDTCTNVYIEAFLLTGQNTFDPNDPTGASGLTSTNILDADVVGPFAVTANGTASLPREIVLHEVGLVDVTPSFLSLDVGQSSPLSASVTDIYGNPISGRSVSWESSNSSVARVNSSGTVTAVAAGGASITASVGGRSSSASIAVQAPRLTVSPANASFTAFRDSGTTITPSSATLSLTSSGGAPIGLSSPSVSYSPSGTAWLSVSLNSSTTPASVIIFPANVANLPNGAYSATITIRSTNSAIASLVIPVSLSVTGSSFSITATNGSRP
jgi:uncharacterized protein YjdB